MKVYEVQFALQLAVPLAVQLGGQPAARPRGAGQEGAAAGQQLDDLRVRPTIERALEAELHG